MFISTRGRTMRPLLGEIDLKSGVLPITKVVPILAELIKRTRINNEHIVITQNGVPAAILMSVESYTQMRELAESQLEANRDTSERED